MIGNKGKIPWYLPGDLARFKKLTMGHTVVMGRKTYESILTVMKDKSKEPLPGREKIVLTRQRNFVAPHCKVQWQWPLIIAEANYDRRNYFIIGGFEIYKIFMPHAERLYLTKVDAEVEGDAFFPRWNRHEWEWAYDPLNMIAETTPQDQYKWHIEDYRRI